MANKATALTDEVQDYLLAHSLPRSDVHDRLVRATAEALGDTAIMQISEEQGPLLTFLTRLVGAHRAVEVGTFTGLSALCIAEGLPEDGELTCFDVSKEWTDIGRPYWDEAGVGGRIQVVIGPAADTLAAHAFEGPIDLAFIDADKGGYVTYYELLLERMGPGALIVFDNALFGGTVLDPDTDDQNGAAVQRVNDLVHADERVDHVLVNVGDGLLLARVR